MAKFPAPDSRSDAPTEKPAASPPPQKGKALLEVDLLEPRILLSATWVDADTGEIQDGSTQGDDIATGDGASDYLYGQDGDDQLFGGSGDDFLEGGLNDDLLDGGEGHDKVLLADATAGTTIDITLDGQEQNLGSLGNDTLHSIEGVVGSEHDDRFAFSQAKNGASYTVDGNGGSNTIDLSGYSSRDVTISEDQIAVDDGSTMFAIDYQNVDTVSLSDGDVFTPAGDNSPPTDLAFSGGIVTENSPAGTVVGSALASDLDGGETFSYALTDNSGGRFEIDAVTGEIRVAEGASIDFETSTNHEIYVEVTDSDGNVYEESLTIDVTDIPTTTITGNATLSTADGPLDDLVINARTVTIDGELDVTGDLTISKLARLNTGELHVSGNVTTLDTNFGGSGTVVLDGAGDQTISAGGGTGQLHHLSIEKSAGVVTLTDEIEITGVYSDNGTTVDATGAKVEFQGRPTLSAGSTTFGDLELNARTVTIDGELDVAGDLTISKLGRLNTGELHVSGNVTTLDTNFSGSGTVVLDGAEDQTISAGGGTGQLHHLSIEKSAGVVTLADEIEITGAYSDNGTTVDATGAKVELQGNPTLSAGSTTFGDLELNAGTVRIDGELDVAGDLTISKLGRLNTGELHVSGNVTTLDTNFSGNGTVVLDGAEDQTISAGGGTGQLHHLSIEKSAGVVTLADEIEITGVYSDNGTTVDATGAKVELQGNPTLSAGSTTFGDLELNAGTVRIDGELDVAGDLTISKLSRLNTGELHVSGNVTTLDKNFGGSGTVVLDGAGDQTISAGGGTGQLHHLSIEKSAGVVTLADEIEITGVYSDNGTTVDATGAKVELQGNPTLSAGSTTFGDLELNAGTVRIDGELDVAGDLTISKLSRLNTGELHVSGNVTTLDKNFGGSGTVVLDGAGDQTISAGGGTGQLHHLSIEKSAGVVTLADEIEITGVYSDNGTTVDATGAKVELQGNPTLSAGSTTFGDLELNAGTVTIDGELDVAGDLTISKLARLNTGELHVSGNVTTLDTNFSGSGTVVLDGAGDQTISAGGGTGQLHHLSIEKSAGVVTLTDEIEITGVYSDNGTTVDATGAKVELQGRPTLSAGSTTFGDLELNAGTVRVDGDVWVDGDLTVTRLHRLEGGTIHVSGEIHVVDGSWHGNGEIVTWEQDVNEAPTDLDFSGGAITENSPAGTIVGTASAADPDSGETFTYELSDNAAGRFEIDPQTGVVTVAADADLNFEVSDSHTIVVKVTDSAGHELTETIAIDVLDVNEGLTDLDFRGGAITEDAPAGTIVGTASAADPDSEETFTYELSDNAAGRFEIDPQTGIVTVTAGADLNFEVSDSHTIVVKATDSAGHELTESIAIDILNVNEGLTDLDFRGGAIAENAPAGTIVGTASAADPDSGETFTYELSDNAAGRFEIDPQTGVVTVAADADLNFEVSDSHTIVVKATDSAGHELTESIAIDILNVNEGLTDLDFRGGAIAENAPAGTIVGTASAADPDSEERFTYELSDNAAGRFEIDPQTGIVTVAAGADLNFEVSDGHTIVVKVTDSAGHELTESIAIDILNVNEGLTDLDFSGGAITENAPAGTIVGTASAADPDSEETFTYELSDNAAGRFEIDPQTGIVTVTAGADLNFEVSNSHTIVVKVTDSAGHTREISHVVELTDQYDTPELEHANQDGLGLARSTSEQADDVEDAILDQEDLTSDFQVDPLDANSLSGFGAGNFVPVAEDSDRQSEKSPDWTSVHFGEAVQVKAVEDDLDGGLEVGAVPDEVKFSGFGSGDAEESMGTTARSNLLAKLWGFARAFRGVSDSKR